MHAHYLRVGVVVAVLLASSLAIADQKIKTKSNIKNDRMAEISSSPACPGQKEGAVDTKADCKTAETKGSASSAPSQELEKAKP